MRLEAAYRRSLYCAGPVAARPGRRSASADAWLAAHGLRAGAILTAWNPGSRRHPRGWNEARQRELAAAARRLPCAEGWSGLGGWWEHTLLLGADPRRVAVLARRFRQRAVLLLRRGRPAVLAYAPSFVSKCAFTAR